ncbi:DUF1677 family protein (DUF1677) [Rhynchospora pubera]|uniref:DUF1677 family protein (DUF1677) n=1 Tax=Rhynchospora pubera TaxID=906938 RepID=A0AAV8BS40_9POAL|nr:DUF1677 family protein (DUF1677) [Rhynchospora pubera]
MFKPSKVLYFPFSAFFILSKAMSMPVPVPAPAQDLESATCECCGLTEECTSGYVNKIRERHHGRWICGLCAEAVRYEMCQSEWQISIEEAIDRHVGFLERFKAGAAPPPEVASERLIQAVCRLLRRSLDSPRSAVGDGTERTRELERSRSCFAALGR